MSCEGLNLGTPRQEPRLYGCLHRLVRIGPTGGKDWVGFGEGHEPWLEELKGRKDRSLCTEFILPVGEDSTLHKALKAVFSLGAVEEGDGVGKNVEEKG